MPRHPIRLFLSAAALLLALVACARADAPRFDRSGAALDGNDGVVPGVTVALKNVETGFVRCATRDDQGRCAFPALSPTGRWTLSVELQGFAPQNGEGLEFQAN